MKLRTVIYATIFLAISTTFIYAQNDEANFEIRENVYYSKIKKSINNFKNEEHPKRKSFVMDFSKYSLPKSTGEFESFYHRKPHSQGNTGTCWDFSTTSFFESEIYRLHNKKVSLSEIWTAYWEYVEKAKSFISTRGKSIFEEGSEANAVTRIWEKYGVIPAKDYSGMLAGQEFHDHSTMYREMRSYLTSVKKTNSWSEAEVIKVIKSILNHYLGVPPTNVNVDGKNYTPKQYLSDYLKLNLSDYVDIVSYMQEPYWEQVEYKVPDNWWHDSSYYNIPLDVFTSAVDAAIKNGFTLAIGGDVSEPGIDGHKEVAMIPSFDIPAEYIDQYARQFRFSNRTTTDDHGIHLVGYTEKDGKTWYLIKDSGSRAYCGPNFRYMFYDENYVKLKIMDFMVHKDAVRDILVKFK